MSFEYINKSYGVNACVGRRVVIDGEPGIIVGTHGAYIVVNPDHLKPHQTANYHPTWRVQYLEMGKVRKMTVGQKRYQKYLDADWFDGTFAEWLGVDKKSKDRREEAKRWGLI